MLPAFVGLVALVWLVYQLVDNPFLTVISSLDTYLLVFVVLGLVLHGTPRALPRRHHQGRARRPPACWCSTRCTPRWRPC